MRIELTDTTSSAVAARLVALRDEGGAVALSRVLTLLVSAYAQDVDAAIEATNTASREHPCRVIVVVPTDGDAAGLDAEIRVGADAGASEVIVLRPRGDAAGALDSLVMPLLLPDAPIVTWWPGAAPLNPRTDPLGAMAQRRITDVLQCSEPRGSLAALAAHYSPGDTDLAWARATLWRGLIAAALDQPPFTQVTGVTITGNLDHPSLVLLGAWLSEALQIEVSMVPEENAPALTGVVLHRENGDVEMRRPVDSTVLHISDPSGITHRVALPLRTVEDALIEDLRRLDEDQTYGAVLAAAATRLAASTTR